MSQFSSENSFQTSQKCEKDAAVVTEVSSLEQQTSDCHFKEANNATTNWSAPTTSTNTSMDVNDESDIIILTIPHSSNIIPCNIDTKDTSQECSDLQENISTNVQLAMELGENTTDDEADIIRLSPLHILCTNDKIAGNNVGPSTSSDFNQHIAAEDNQICPSDEDELSSSDEELQLHEINRLNAIFETDESTRDYSSQDSSTASIYSTKDKERYYKIQSALALNKETDEKLARLERVLMSRLHECQQKLKEINLPNSSIDKHEKTFRYVYCGKPYFRGPDNFPGPENEDTLLMSKLKMYDFSLVMSVPGWTMKDKSQFLSLLHTMSVDLKKKQLQSQISQLQREANGGKKFKKCIADIQKEINGLKKKSLDQLALPIHEEYDWDTIANKTNRHAPQEYRSLWKLFLHPSINKNSWTKDEHLSLQKIAHANNLQNWDKIAGELNTGRTGYQCFVYFRTNMSNTLTSQKWTKEEEEYLKRLIDYYREGNYIPWSKVTSCMENRTKIQIYNKYYRLIENRKGRFVPEEDAVLLTCVKDFGTHFKRITKYLPGRSATQLRRRYQVLLNETRTSMVWSAEEDKKLIQFMANQDTSTNYASLTKHFPGKDRANIRARYTTLVKWMRKHPHSDVSNAPRRGARRLDHGQASQDLNKAVESLKNRIQTDVQTKKGSKITKDSCEDDIEHAIITTLINEKIKEEELQKSKINELVAAGGIGHRLPQTSQNISNLYKMLILLKVKLDKSKFTSSNFFKSYEELLNSHKQDSYVLVKSYSKKESIKVFKQEKPDIWGERVLETSEYVLPPNYATITGCRKLMAYCSNKPVNMEPSLNINAILRKNILTKKHFLLLLERFNSLFLWPMLLSNEGPKLRGITYERVSVVKPKTVPQSGDPGVTIPVSDKVIINENINLEECANREDLVVNLNNKEFMFTEH